MHIICFIWKHYEYQNSECGMKKLNPHHNLFNSSPIPAMIFLPFISYNIKRSNNIILQEINNKSNKIFHKKEGW